MTEEEILQQASEALDSAIQEKNRNKDLIRTLGPAIVEALKPALESLAENSRLTKQDIKDAISEISFNLPEIIVPKPEVTVNVPEIKVPKAQVDVSIPEIKLPTIKIPKITVPRPEVTVNVAPPDLSSLKMPKYDFPKSMEMSGNTQRTPMFVSVVNQVNPPRVVELRRTVDIQSVPIEASSNGDNTLVLGQVNKTIRVIAFHLQGTGTVNAKFTDGAGGVDLTGAYNFQAREGNTSPAVTPPYSLFQTTPGNALVLNLSAGVQVVGFVSFFTE